MSNLIIPDVFLPSYKFWKLKEEILVNILSLCLAMHMGISYHLEVPLPPPLLIRLPKTCALTRKHF